MAQDLSYNVGHFMALREEFEIQGNMLFKWRSYLPLIVVCLFPYIILKYTPHVRYSVHQYWSIVCIFISFLGLGLRILTLGFVPNGTSGRNTKRQVADSLNTIGMYSLVRHPLYLGNYIIVLGIVLYTMNWWFVVLISLFFWIYYERIMYAEEEFLRNKFGETYEKWASRTSAFIPALRKWETPELPFSVRFVLKKEYTGFFCIVVIYSFMELIFQFSAIHKVLLPFFWVLLFMLSSVFYIIILVVKKKTNLLITDNR